MVKAMKVRKFNFGGIFGGLICAAAAAAIIYLLADQHFPLKAIKIVAVAGFGGAALGSWIWGLAAPPAQDDFSWETSASRVENHENS